MKKINVCILLLFILPLINGGVLMALEIKSPVFKEGGSIPLQYTCKGSDISPPLSWSGVPKGAKSMALICDDPDAPGMTWVHWVVYNISPDENGLKEDLAKSGTLPGGTLQGITDFRKIGYGGPCPPPGGPHRYYFKLYALDKKPELKAGATKDMLLKSMDGYILEEAQLMGTFKR